MKNLLCLMLLTFSVLLTAQDQDSTINGSENSADKLLAKEGNLMIGGYAEVHYNQELSAEDHNIGKLDVHRMVMLMAYRFNQRSSFVTEIEFEHVKEVYVEQAFMQYKLNQYLNFRAGLLLIPMGLINEYHEPTAFFGVERPLLDKYIVPSTWREIGAGINGNIIDASLKYQAYIVNGFNGYDGTPTLSGENALRKGRQKGAESYISSPAFSAKLEYYGLGDLRFGLSTYLGKTQSSLFDGINRNDQIALERADSSVVSVSMIGVDLRYNFKGLQMKGQYYYTVLGNTESYNQFTGITTSLNDLGSAMTGFYAEVSYDVLSSIESSKTSLFPFIRYEMYDTHAKVAEGLESNDSYNKSIITGGLSWYPARGAVVKADIQMVKSAADETFKSIFNAGIGVMF